MRIYARALPLLAILLVLPTAMSLRAATQNALVTGSVFDQNGAAVPGATVRLINASIGFSQSLQTDANGNFTFGSVPPAENYVISVEISGFATVIRPGLTIAVGEAKLVLPPFILQPAAQPGQEITEEAPKAAPVTLDLVSTTLGGVADSRTVRTLPLVGRDFLDLTLLIPGTYPVEQGSALEGASLVINGVRANMNNFLLDGADNNDYTVNQSLPFQIVEALQEFRVQTSTSNAEFGRNAGAQINLVSRSGSNDVHGTVFWFNRNSALSAENALSTYRGGSFDAFAQAARINQILRGPTTAFPTPVLSDPVLSEIFDRGRDPDVNQNQLGANLGAPIVKDKVFFFFNWESARADNDRPVFERVPDLFFRQRFFIFDPSTRRANSLLNLYPAPNVPLSQVRNRDGFPVSDPLTGDVRSRFPNPSGAFAAGDSANSTSTDNFLERIDWRAGERASLSFKHNIQRIRQIQGGELYATSSYPGSGTRVTGRNQNFSVNYLHQLSDRTGNEFRFGWNRFRLTSRPLDSALDASALFSNLNFTDKGLPTFLIGGFNFTFGSYAPLGADFNTPNDRANNVWSFADNISRTWGRHVLKAGVEFRHNRLNATNEALARGLVTFFDVPFGASSGAPDLASIARVSPAFGGGFDRAFSANSFDWFVQDIWRPRSNVSFTFGLRHEINQAPRETRDRLVNNYPGACPQLVCLIRSGSDTILDSDGSSLGTASFTAPRAGFDTDFNNFGPHLGLAWDPWKNGKTVFRGAYGITFDQQSLQPSANMLLNPPFVQQAASFFPFVSLGDLFPPGFPRRAVGFFDVDGDGFDSILFRQSYSITARDPDTRTSYVHQFNLGWQQQLGNSSAFEAAYVGSAGHKLPRNRLLLECTANIFSRDPLACLPPLFVGGGGLTDSVVNQENTANSSFHSLQLRWETRNFHGLTLHLHYQWGHSIDSASSANTPVFLFSPPTASLLALNFVINADQFASLNNANPALSLRPGLPIITTRGLLPNDSQNLGTFAGERGDSDFDVRHRFVLHYMYDVPRWAPGIGAGWQLAGITTLQSGQPYTVFGDFFGVPLRPDLVGTPNTDNDNAGGALDNATPAGCNVSGLFPCPGTGSVSAFNPTRNLAFFPGSLSRNTFKGPGLVNFDFSILKNNYLGRSERANIQFRVEFFNLFNHTNFRQPFGQTGQFLGVPGFSFAIPNPFFGQILQTRPGREIQWGLKFIF